MVNWKVTALEGGLSVLLTDTAGNANANQQFIDNTDADDNMNLTYQEKLVRKAMKQHEAYDGDKYYLFFFDAGKNNSQGYMVFNSHFGFIFKNSQNPDELIRTIAHEPGHGVFRLRHTFCTGNKYPQTQGSTDNLMDYTSQALTARRLLKYQWDYIHDPESMWFTMWENEEEGANVMITDSNKDLKFVIGNEKFNINQSYYSIYCDNEIEIKLVNENSKVNIDLTNIKWKVAGKEIASKIGNPSCILLKINELNLPKQKNELLVFDDQNKPLARLVIKPYYAPQVFFEEALGENGADFKGEYFFDKSFKKISTIATNTYYDTIQFGTKKLVIYSPVLGLNINQTAKLKINVYGPIDNAVEDNKLKILVKPRKAGVLLINGQTQFELTASDLSKIDIEIEIKAIQELSSINESTAIDFIESITNQKLGSMQYYCSSKVDKDLDLIYVKFTDETQYPSEIQVESFKSYINKYAFNQLFINFKSINRIELPSKFKTSDFKGLNSEEILRKLTLEKFGKPKMVSGYNLSKDFMFITDLEILKPESTDEIKYYVGGGTLYRVFWGRNGEV